MWRQLRDILSFLKTNVINPVKYRTIRKYHILDLRRAGNNYTIGWHDADTKMLWACFLLLKDYVEKEKPFELINWNSGEESSRAEQEIKCLYKWWTEERSVEHGKLLVAWNNSGHKVDFEKIENSDCYKMIYTGEDPKSLFDEERRLELKDDEMLERLMKIRHFLWT